MFIHKNLPSQNEDEKGRRTACMMACEPRQATISTATQKKTDGQFITWMFKIQIYCCPVGQKFQKMCRVLSSPSGLVDEDVDMQEEMFWSYK